MRIINPTKNKVRTVSQPQLITNKIDSYGILTQLNRISLSPLGLNLFRGNKKYLITHGTPQPTKPNILNKHGTQFQGFANILNITSILKNSNISTSQKVINGQCINANNKVGYKPSENIIAGEYEKNFDKYLMNKYSLFLAAEKNTTEALDDFHELTKLNTKFNEDYYTLTFE